MNEMIQEGHLGGFIKGGDPATFFPELWDWAVNGPLSVKSVLDLGCGEGHALNHFRELGCEVTGIDGVQQEDPAILVHDFEESPWKTKKKFDLVWTCEFLEHIEEEKASNLVPALSSGKIVLMTHAFPGQQGHHHVNCREPDYWRGFMIASGFRYSKGLTDKTRELAQLNKDPYNHYLRSGMAFRKVN